MTVQLQISGCKMLNGHDADKRDIRWYKHYSWWHNSIIFFAELTKFSEQNWNQQPIPAHRVHCKNSINDLIVGILHYLSHEQEPITGLLTAEWDQFIRTYAKFRPSWIKMTSEVLSHLSIVKYIVLKHRCLVHLQLYGKMEINQNAILIQSFLYLRVRVLAK